MKKLPLPFRPLALFVLLAACRAHGDSATWTGAAVVPDNLWATIDNWTLGIASVPGTALGETATFTTSAFPGVGVSPPLTSIKFLNFNGTSTHTFSAAIPIEDTGAVTIDAGTVAQTLNLAFPGNGTITNNGDLLTSTVAFSGIAGQLLTFGGTGNITLSGNIGTSPGGVVKSGSGTLTLPSSNTGVTGGFTFTGGTAIAGNQNSFSNKVLNLNGGTAQMNANATANYTGTVVNANSTLAISNPAATAIEWKYGATAVTNLLTSTGSPVLSVRNASTTLPTVNNYISMNLVTSGFDGTWKLGDSTVGGLMFVNSANSAGGPNVKVDIGDAGSTGVHVLGTSAILTSGTSVVPVVIGELKGTLTTGILAGRRQQGTRSTGTRFEVGGLGTNSSFSGIIADGVTNSGVRQMNGNPDCTASVAPDAGTTYLRTNGIAGSQGTVEFVKTGAGTLTLLSNNTYSGGTILQGGVLAVSGDGALGATYDGSLRPFTVIIGTAIYAPTDLPDAALTGGNPTTPAAIGMFSSQFGSWGGNREYISFSSQNNDTDFGNITNTQTGTGYTSLPTVSFTGGTVTTPGTDPVVTVRVKGLLTFDGGTLKTNTGITSNRATVLAAGGGTFDSNGFDSTLSGVVNGTGNLTKTGAGKLAMTGSNTYTGDTLVSLGTLAVNGTSIGNAAKLTITGGKVEVVANETVGTLFLGAAQQAAGTYGATGSGAAHINDTYFTGAGMLTVASGPAGGYAAWATVNAPGQTADLDYDLDGVQNGMEYFMGATGSGFTALPVPVNGKVTWTKDPAYSGTYMIQTSSTMAAGSWVDVPVNGINPKDNGNSVEYTLPTGSDKLFSRIQVTPN